MDNKKKGRNILIVVLLLISAAAVCVTIWALFFRDDGQLTPDYAPVDEEANAEEIPDDSGEKMEVPEGGGSVSLTYTREVSIELISVIKASRCCLPIRENRIRISCFSW